MKTTVKSKSKSKQPKKTKRETQLEYIRGNTEKILAQLDRIEHKIDELMIMALKVTPNIQPPGTRTGPFPHTNAHSPYEKAPWWMNPALPRDDMAPKATWKERWT